MTRFKYITPEQYVLTSPFDLIGCKNKYRYTGTTDSKFINGRDYFAKDVGDELLMATGEDGHEWIVPKDEYEKVGIEWSKIFSWIKSHLMWLRVVFYYAIAFGLVYFYLTTYDFLITIPCVLIFISFLMVDKILTKL